MQPATIFSAACNKARRDLEIVCAHAHVRERSDEPQADGRIGFGVVTNLLEGEIEEPVERRSKGSQVATRAEGRSRSCAAEPEPSSG